MRWARYQITNFNIPRHFRRGTAAPINCNTNCFSRIEEPRVKEKESLRETRSIVARRCVDQLTAAARTLIEALNVRGIL